MIAETSSEGRTPAQTVSRVLQELRDKGLLFFSSAGVYVINDVTLDAAREEFPEDVLDHAAQSGSLLISDVDAFDMAAQTRVRRGMAAVRRATLFNFRSCCALCDIGDPRLLVASHIARWADRPSARGQLTNVICLCRLHDPLFESGYFALGNDLSVMWRPKIESEAIRAWATEHTKSFRTPLHHSPAVGYVKEHRLRVGL